MGEFNHCGEVAPSKPPKADSKSLTPFQLSTHFSSSNLAKSRSSQLEMGLTLRGLPGEKIRRLSHSCLLINRRITWHVHCYLGNQSASYVPRVRDLRRFLLGGAASFFSELFTPDLRPNTHHDQST